MSRRSPLVAVCVVLAACARHDGDAVARVGLRTFHLVEVRQRAAHGHQTFCSALEEIIDEEVVLRVTCAQHPEIRGCGTERDEILDLAIRDAAGPPGPAEVEAVSNESEFLRRRAPMDSTFAVTLARLRKARAALRELALRHRSGLRVRILAPCERGEVDVPS